MLLKPKFPVKSLNTWRLGTTVKYYSLPETRSELISTLQYGSDTKYGNVFLGLGSNVLMPDDELDAHLIEIPKDVIFKPCLKANSDKHE